MEVVRKNAKPIKGLIFSLMHLHNAREREERKERRGRLVLISSVSRTGTESGVGDVLLLVFLQTFWYVWGQGWVERPYHCIDIQLRR